MATQVISRISDSFQIDFPVRALFENPTISQLAISITSVLMSLETEDDLTQVLAEIRQLPSGDAAHVVKDSTIEKARTKT